jgi:hypothetical protein
LEEIVDAKAHWNHVYDTKDEQAVSWFEASPLLSIEMLVNAGLTSTT